MKHTRLFNCLTALSIRLQLRRALGQENLFSGDWESQIAQVIGLGDKPDELKVAIAALQQTIQCPAQASNSLIDSVESVRKITEILKDTSREAYTCDLFEFGRSCEEACVRICRYREALERVANFRF